MKRRSENLAQILQRSNQLEGCQSIIKDFETINPVKRYKSDWKTFLNESRVEDFVRINGETIYVYHTQGQKKRV